MLNIFFIPLFVMVLWDDMGVFDKNVSLEAVNLFK